MYLDIMETAKTADRCTRPAKACDDCRHLRGGNWLSETDFEVICDLQPSKKGGVPEDRVTAPEVDECPIHEAGCMFDREKRAA